MMNKFPEKLEKNYSLKSKKLDLNFKPRNTKYSIISSEYFSSRKIESSNINQEDDEKQLSSAYKNINLMISNYIESIKAEDKDRDKNKKSFLNSILKKRSKNFKNTYHDSLRKNTNMNKSLSLSNSNIVMKTSEENILNIINKDKKQNESPGKLNPDFMKAISIKSSKAVKKNLSKFSSLFNNNNTSSLFSPKRNNKNRKYVLFLPQKKENESEVPKEKSEKKNSSASKLQRVKLKNEKEYSNMLFSYNNDTSPINKNPIRKRPKSFHIKQFQVSNSLINNTNDTKISSKKLSSNITQETKNSKKSLNSKISKMSYNSKAPKLSLNPKVSKAGNIYKKAKTILLSSKKFGNIFDKQNKKVSTIKTRKFKNTDKDRDMMKILTVKDIGNNIKKTIIGFDYNELKKELYDFENNECTNIINKLPEKIEDNKEKIDLKESMNMAEFNKTSTNNNGEELFPFKKEETIRKVKAYRIQQKYRKLFISKTVYDSLDDEEIGDEEEINSFYLAPNSLTVYLIDLFVLFFSFIELFYLPFFLSYNIHKCKLYFLTVNSLLFYSADLIYIIDLVSGFFRAFYNFEEILIKDNSLICINYLTGWFLLDLIQAIPFYTILNINQEKCDNNTIYNHLNYSYIYNFHYSFLIIKIIKIFKTLNKNSALNRIIYFLNKNDFFYNWRGVFFTILVALSSLHFCSCYFIFLGRNVHPGWIVKCNLDSYSFHHIYIASLYYVMTTLTTVGYGDIIVVTQYERFYQILLLIVGTCAYSWILTFISNYIKKKNEKYIDFENKLNILGEIKISYPNLNNDLYEKILRYLHYNKSEYKYNVENILESLPSSLQNNLIVEMYKPIIKNFHFFKSFENSDFFVKIVTSLKSILCMKDDILIQEGDVIEDIIFIKKGVLSLEILIDLDSAKESAEKHLNIGRNGTMNIFYEQATAKSKRDSKFNNSVSMASQNTNMNFTRNTKCERKKGNKKAMKIIDLRKNEHYGDILMILNERSPLTVKVKSKKAELFLLQKTDATEISNEYPNIWKRIVNKSLYNMKQIKYLIRKKVIIFCDLNDIMINSDLKKIFLEENGTNGKSLFSVDKKIKNNNSNIKFQPKKQIETIIYEEDENFDSLRNTYALNDKKAIKSINRNFPSKFLSNKLVNKLHSNEKLQLSNISKNLKKLNTQQSLKININNSKKDILIDESNSKSNKENFGNKSEKLLIEIDDNLEKKTSSKINSNSVCNINNMISIIDEKMKSSKKLINNFNINIFTPKTVQIPINQINNSISVSEPNISNQNAKYEDNNMENINNEIYFNEDFKINVSGKTISMNNNDKNNDYLYPNLKGILGNKTKNIKFENNLSNIKKLLDNNKTSSNYLNIKSDFSNYNEISPSINSNFTKSNKFLYLNNIKNISFTISSVYENFNQLSKYKFQCNSILRQKTKNFVLRQCFARQKSLEFSNSRQKRLEDNFSITNKTGYQHNQSKTNSVVYLNNRQVDDELSKNRKRLFSVDTNKNMSSSIKRQKTNDVMGNIGKKRGSFLFRKKRQSSSNLNYSFISQKENLFNKKQLKKTIFYNTISEYESENERSYFSRVETLRKGTKFKERETSPKDRVLNLQDKISLNIEKNKQNLNNPEEYFSGFFNDILLRKKTMKNIKNNNKDQKSKKMKTLFYKKKDNNIFSNSASKNKNNIDATRLSKVRRNSTLNDEINRNHANLNFKI